MRGLEILGVCFAVVLAVGTGCSSDESSDRDAVADHHPDGGETQEGGAGTGSPSSLPDQTAGNSCKSDEDCGSGMCLASFAGAFGAESMTAPGGYCSAACMSNADCGEGGVCSGAFPGLAGGAGTPGRCLKGCTSPDDCREGYRCLNALGMAATGGQMPDPTGGLLGPSGCQPVPATTQLENGVAGKPCQEDAECGRGRCLKSEGTMTYAGGYCTGSCLKDSDCGESGSCALPLLGGGAGNCYRSCQSHGDTDCREGYRCRSNSSRRQCLPGAAALGDHVAGRECTADADCGGAAMSCVTMLGNVPAPGGYCSQPCSDNTDCGADGTCVGGLGAAFASLLGTTGTCYRACSDSSSCREGYVCGQPTASMSIPGAGAIGGMASSTACVVASADGEDAGVP